MITQSRHSRQFAHRINTKRCRYKFISCRSRSRCRSRYQAFGYLLQVQVQIQLQIQVYCVQSQVQIQVQVPAGSFATDSDTDPASDLNPFSCRSRCRPQPFLIICYRSRPRSICRSKPISCKSRFRSRSQPFFCHLL